MRFGRILLVCCLTLAALAVSNVSSRSEQAPPARQNMIADDQCLSLLALDRGQGDMTRPSVRSSDAIARQTAMGLMLGVRSVVGPREGTGVRQKAKGVDSAYAQAVARYRHCRSEQALESFASN